MTTTTAARRSGTSSAGSKLDLTQLACDLTQHRNELRSRTENLIEASIKKTRELRIAGMINKQGADTICNNLILAMQALEEMG